MKSDLGPAEVDYILDRRQEMKSATLVERARNHFLPFIKATKRDYKINWHHRLMAKKLDAFAKGKIPRLMIWTPPRHGKTEQASTRLPAYIFGRNPDANIIATSYGAELASKNNRGVQRVMDTPIYRKIFPATTLNHMNVRSNAAGSYIRNSDMFEIVGARGYYRSAGIDGTITGMGADFLLIDDPIKNKKQAESATYRDMIWDQWTSTLSTRLEENGAVLIIMTRWHEDDLCGRLLKLAEEDPEADQWEVLCLPAIMEQSEPGRKSYKHPKDPRKVGEALWPGKYPIERLSKIKKNSSQVWNGLFQQRPTALEGGIIKTKWLNERWTVKPQKFDRMIASWDMSFKDTPGASFVVGTIWGKIKAQAFLLDLKREQMDFPTTVQAVKDMAAKWPMAFEKYVESKANGPAVVAQLKKDVPGLIEIEPDGSKESRLSSVSGFFKAGNIILPDASIAPWVKDYIEELVNFPNAPNNDQVDSTSQALLCLFGSAVGDWKKLLETKPTIRTERPTF